MRNVSFLQKLTSAERAISLGCGVAPEAEFFKEHIGIDHNPQYKPTILGNALVYLDNLEDASEDLFLALDIDSNIPIVRLCELAHKKLKGGGQLIITERRENKRIYGRLLVEPYINTIIQGWESKLYSLEGFELFALVLTKPLKESFREQP